MCGTEISQKIFFLIRSLCSSILNLDDKGYDAAPMVMTEDYPGREEQTGLLC